MLRAAGVDPSLRGRGIGRRLFAAVEQWFSVRSVVFEVSPTRNTGIRS